MARVADMEVLPSTVSIDYYEGGAMADFGGSPSRTAVLTAVARSVHRQEPAPRVLDDYLALDLAGADGVALRERLRAEVPPALLLAFGRWMCVRARFAEDVVERSVRDGVPQYVILGAGLDTFAYRRRDLLDRLGVFEVDHPATQSWKRRRLAAIGVDLPADLVYAPVDFEPRPCGRDWGRPGSISASRRCSRGYLLFQVRGSCW